MNDFICTLICEANQVVAKPPSPSAFLALRLQAPHVLLTLAGHLP